MDTELEIFSCCVFDIKHTLGDLVPFIGESNFSHAIRHNITHHLPSLLNNVVYDLHLDHVLGKNVDLDIVYNSLKSTMWLWEEHFEVRDTTSAIPHLITQITSLNSEFTEYADHFEP